MLFISNLCFIPGAIAFKEARPESACVETLCTTEIPTCTVDITCGKRTERGERFYGGSKFNMTDQFTFVCMWSVLYKSAVWLHSAALHSMWRKCGAGEVVGGGKGFGRAGVEQGILVL